MTMHLIGMYGRARSGKDTAAAYLANKYRLHQYLFAAPLKDMLTTVFGHHFYNGDRERICPEAGVSYRVLMQTLGTEWGRAINPDLWVNLVDRRWKELQIDPYLDKRISPPTTDPRWGGPAPATGMILSDVRFDSEAKWIQDNGGVVIEVVRKSTDPINGVANHASEQGLSTQVPDFMVDNNGTLESLYAQLDGIFEHLLPGFEG